ncbi:MAG: hypothetical protein GYA71_02640 [Bacteroidales bacterium]|nr:hypothetical protein [Bacteroidales bacterium]
MDIRSLLQIANLSETRLLAFYAGTDIKKWTIYKRYPFIHKTFGIGHIDSLELTEQGKLYICLLFNSPYEGKRERYFLNTSFQDGFFDFADPIENSVELKEIMVQVRQLLESEKEKILEEEILRKKQEEEKRIRLEEENKQKEKEKADRDNFIALKEKYNIKNCHNDSPTSLLYVILLKLEDKELLDQEDIEYLKSEHWYGPIAVDFENRFTKEPSDLWLLVNACSNWRNAKVPSRSIEISANSFSSDKKSYAALLTTRGGAFRDLMNFEAAEDSAKAAIQIQPGSHYPYNLLGAIYYQKGEPEKADEYFGIAIQKGSTPKDVDSEIEHSIKRSNEEVRNKVVAYLLAKDSKRYEWAKKYIKIS